MNTAPDDPRDLLLDCFRAALQRVEGGRAVRRHLAAHPWAVEELDLIAIGKAAEAMTAGALAVFGARLRRGLLVTKQGYLGGPCDPRLVCLEAEHPVPGPASLRAGRALLDFCRGVPAGRPVLVCLSGGASSLVEVLPPGWDLARLAELTRRLLAEGLDIATMNAVRRAVSRLKGGRLARHLQGHEVRVLLISDVPGDDPAVIGSGPMHPPPAEPLPALPPAVAECLADLPPAPPPPPAVFAQIRHEIVANLAMARAAAAARARRRGVPVRVHGDFLDGEACATGRALAEALATLPAGLHVWGGETVVHLVARPGRGGRNQQLALCAAQALCGSTDRWLLAAGTDGSDGPTEDAGALVDGGTCRRGADAGRDLARDIAANDAGRFLAASGDLISTGPTGTNVMDLVLGWRAP